MFLTQKRGKKGADLSDFSLLNWLFILWELSLAQKYSAWSTFLMLTPLKFGTVGVVYVYLYLILSDY